MRFFTVSLRSGQIQLSLLSFALFCLVYVRLFREEIQMGERQSEVKVTQEPDLYMDIQLPGVTSDASEPVLCTTFQFPFDEGYIVGFKPVDNMGPIHHLMLYQCEEPWNDVVNDPVFNCAANTTVHADSKYKSSLFHKCKTTITSPTLFGWDLSPKTFFLPEDTAFLVGQKTRYKYVVLNIHFTRPLTRPDSSGMRIYMRKAKPKYSAGTFNANMLTDIPPQSVFYNDFMCRLPKQPESASLRFFAYGVHTHSLGKVISLYKVSPRQKQWEMIGKDQPYQALNVIPREKQLVLDTQEDFLATRCTLQNSRHEETHMGTHSHGEMCLILLYFYVDTQKTAALPGTFEECVFVNQHVTEKKIGYFPKEASQFRSENYLTDFQPRAEDNEVDSFLSKYI